MNVSAAECKLRNAESQLKSALAEKENENMGNCFDSNIELFRDSVSRATKELAEAPVVSIFITAIFWPFLIIGAIFSNLMN